MNRKKVLICGATGFIGRNIAEFYSQIPEYEVICTYFKSKPFVCNGLRWVQIDLTDSSAVGKVTEGVDILIHGAATTSGSKDIVNSPYMHVTDNAVMSSLLFRSAYENSVERVVYFSCTVMYQPKQTPQREDDFDANHPLVANYFGVGWTKVYLEKMCEFYANLGRTKFTVLRHSNVYGPYDKYDLHRSHVFGATVTKVMQAQSDTIEVWGSGEEERDLLYVDDLVNAVDAAVNNQRDKFGLYNIGYGVSVSINTLVNMIVESARKSLKIIHDHSKPTIKTTVSLDCSKARKELKWKPETSLEDGISKTLAWYAANY